MRKRGLVLSVRGQHVTVLFPDGEFRELPWGSVVPPVGSEIVIAPARRQAWWQVVAVAALLLSLGGVLWGAALPIAAEPMSYVALDINPSVEFYLDAEQKVVQVQGLNDEGQLVVGDGLQGMTLDEALPLLLRDAGSQGYVTPGQSNLVLLAVVPLERGKAPPPLEDMARVLELALGDEVEALVALQEASREDLEAARESGLSLNKHLLRKQRELQGEYIPLAELRNSSIQEVFQRAGISPQEVLLEGFSARQLREGDTWNRVRLVDKSDKTLLVTGPSSLTSNLVGDSKVWSEDPGENGERAKIADNGDAKPSGTVSPPSEPGKPSSPRPSDPGSPGREKTGETPEPRPTDPVLPAEDNESAEPGRSNGEAVIPPEEEGEPDGPPGPENPAPDGGPSAPGPPEGLPAPESE